MNPLLQEKLLDLVVNFIAIVLGGGLITLVIEWRRHKREMQNWQREDATIQIDISQPHLVSCPNITIRKLSTLSSQTALFDLDPMRLFHGR